MIIDSHDVAPVLIMGFFILIPVVKILLNHQHKMTELTYRLNQQTAQPPQPEQLQVRQDMEDLKQLVQQQAIAIDNLSTKLDRMGPSTVQDRLSESA